MTLASTFKGGAFVVVTSFLLYGLISSCVSSAPNASAPGDPPPDTLRQNLPFIFFAAAIITVTAGSISHTFSNQGNKEFTRLQAISTLKTHEVMEWLMERQSDAEFAQTSAYFADNYRRWHTSGDLAGRDVLLARLEQLHQKLGFDAVTLVDEHGQRLWGSARSPDKIAPPLQEAILLAIKDHQVHRVGPYLGLRGTPRMDFIAPLTEAGPQAPLIVLHNDLRVWLYRNLQIWPTPSASGETTVFRRDGERVLFLNKLRHNAAAELTLSAPLTDTNLLAAQVINKSIKPGSLVSGVDYRGVYSIGVVQAVPGTDWLLIAKLDRAEIYGEAMLSSIWIGLAGLLALFMLGTGRHMLRQRQQLAIAASVAEAQAERMRALNLLSAIADSSDDAIFAKDLEGRYILFNRAASRFVSQPAEAVLGHDDRTIFPPEQAEMLMGLDRHVITTGQNGTAEEELDSHTGQRILLGTKGPLRDADGKIVGVFGISRDITERKRVERELRESTNSLRTLINSVPDMIWLKDTKGVYQLCNRRFESFFGASEADIIGKTDYDFVEQTQADVFRANDLAAIEALKPKINEEEVTFASDGHKELLQTVKMPFHDVDGKLVGVLGVARDITAIKAAEDELRCRFEALQRFNRATVGRELDMIALKQQINALNRELGREPPYPLAFLDQPPSGETQ
jgi:PAS domain S-box-containing protein